jgi:hypothetical protein
MRREPAAGRIAQPIVLVVDSEHLAVLVDGREFEPERLQQAGDGAQSRRAAGLDALDRRTRDIGQHGKLALAHAPRAPGGAHDSTGVHAAHPAGPLRRSAAPPDPDVDIGTACGTRLPTGAGLAAPALVAGAHPGHLNTW